MKNDFYKFYINELIKNIKKIPDNKIKEIVKVIYNAYKNEKQIFIMGNGGSGATASHFACDLGKGTAREGKPRFRVISLNDNMPLLTALSNDFGYNEVFKEQLKNLLNPEDVVIALTASGNSENILNAILYAKTKGARTIGLVGFDGGKLIKIVDTFIWINSNSYERVEDIHLILEHLISSYFRKELLSYK